MCLYLAWSVLSLAIRKGHCDGHPRPLAPPGLNVSRCLIVADAKPKQGAVLMSHHPQEMQVGTSYAAKIPSSC